MVQNNPLFSDDPDLRAAFGTIKDIASLTPVQQVIAEGLHGGRLSVLAFTQLLKEHGVSLSGIKEALMDLLILYIKVPLEDHLLSASEKQAVGLLKRLFRIREGDFYRLRHEEIQQILHDQLERMYRDDNRIDLAEAMHKVELQDIFDLSYDQMLAFKEQEVRLAIDRGARIEELDTVRRPKDTR